MGAGVCGAVAVPRGLRCAKSARIRVRGVALPVVVWDGSEIIRTERQRGRLAPGCPVPVSSPKLGVAWGAGRVSRDNRAA